MENVLEKQKEVKRKTNPFQKFIFLVLIPLLFAIFIGLLIASVAGVNVFQKAKDISGKLPFVTEKTEKENIADFENKLISLDAEIKNKNVEIEQLQAKLENNETEKERFLLEKKQLEQTIDELKIIKDENKRAFKEIVSTYEAMAPKSAAPIILEMNDSEAVKVLSNLSTDQLAKIMEKMPPKNAAKYMELLSSTVE